MYMHQRIGAKNPIYTDVDWVIAKDYNSFVNTIQEKGIPELVSFDHDLADEHYDNPYEPDERLIVHPGDVKINYDLFREKTGYDCAKWLVEYCLEKEQNIPEFLVHSLNPTGTENIQKYLENAKKHQEKENS